MKAITKKHNALLQVRQFLTHIEGRVGPMAFDSISQTVENAIKAKEKIKVNSN